MSRIMMLIPIGTDVGLTSVSLGVLRAMEHKRIKASFLNPSPSHGRTNSSRI